MSILYNKVRFFDAFLEVSRNIVAVRDTIPSGNKLNCSTETVNTMLSVTLWAAVNL